MIPAFDATTGLLRLPALAVELLGRLAAGDDQQRLTARAPDAFALLERLGVVEHGGLHPAVVALAEAIARPLVRMVVRVGPPAAPVEARAWLDAGFAAYARPVDGILELAPGPPSGAPVFAAGLVDLGPRPPAPARGVVTVPDRAVRELLGSNGSPDPEAVLAVAGLPPAWRAPLALLAEACRCTWSVQVRWMVGEGRVAQRSVGVIDGGTAGLWRYERPAVSGRDLASLSPTRTREVWRELCALLPSERELLTSPPV